MVTFERFSKMYIKFQFWGSEAVYLRFETSRKALFGIFVPIEGINKNY